MWGRNILINKLACYSHRSSHIYHTTICQLSPVQGLVIIIDTFLVMTGWPLVFWASHCALTVIIVQLQRVQVKGQIIYNTAVTDIISSFCCYGGVHYCISFWSFLNIHCSHSSLYQRWTCNLDVFIFHNSVAFVWDVFHSDQYVMSFPQSLWLD